MADAVDRANKQTELHLSIALENRQKPSCLVSARECEACGTEIPQARQLAIVGVALCVDCQHAEEVKRKRYR